jgi:alpha-L-rhamnosidase
MLKRWLAFVAAHADPDGHLAEPACWGDWVAWPDQAATKPYLGNAYFCRSADLLSRLAESIGESADARTFATLAARSRAAIRHHYQREAPLHFDNGTQSALVHALHFGLCEQADRPTLVAALESALDRHGRVTTGCLGTTCLLPVLSASGRDELAFRLLTAPDRNWGWWLSDCDATTALETWSGERSSSYNHPFLIGSACAWLYRRAAGISPASPGYATVRIAPCFPTGLDWCEATVETPRGLVTARWQRDDCITLDFTTPPGTDIVLDLPPAPVELPGGTHRIVISKP